MKGGVVAILAILAVAAAVVQRGEAVSCGEVEVALLPCVDFLRGRVTEPPTACCNGVRAVKEMAVTPGDKKTACACVKAVAISFSGLIDKVAQTLPDKCGIKLDFSVSRNVNCNRPFPPSFLGFIVSD